MDVGEDAVDTGETILRRVHKNHVNGGPPPVVSFLAFRPSKDDTVGLSVYREKLASPEAIAAAGRKPGEYYLVRLSVESLRTLGLTVVPDEQPDGPRGHALIPELSVTACDQDRKRLREVQVRLAELASQAIILHATA